VTKVTVAEAGDPKAALAGDSKGETADRNDILAFELTPGREYTVKAGAVEKTIKPEAGKELLVEIELK
jgi:hypothetical protein